jgi:hypothetical protein
VIGKHHQLNARASDVRIAAAFNPVEYGLIPADIAFTNVDLNRINRFKIGFVVRSTWTAFTV